MGANERHAGAGDAPPAARAAPSWHRHAGAAVAVALSLVVAVTVTAALVRPHPAPTPSGAPTPCTTTSTRPPTTTPATTTPATTTPATTTPATTTPVTTVPGLLAPGATGPEVVALQERLRALGYWLPAPGGIFDQGTEHAVVALQKVAGLERDGVVGPATRAALDSGTAPSARSSAGRVIEIDLDRQVLLVVLDGHVDWTLDTSTGAQPGTTPKGRFTIFRQLEGYVTSPLGVLYRPKYFTTDGVAVHGYPSVPPYPASHGCVRVTNDAMDLLWTSDLAPIGTPVWVY